MDHYGFSFEPKGVVVIGDTPKDIHCAKAINARVFTAAPGSFTFKELLAHEPDHIFEHLEDTEAILSTIEGN